MYSYGSPHTAAQKQDDQHESTFSSYVKKNILFFYKDRFPTLKIALTRQYNDL